MIDGFLGFTYVATVSDNSDDGLNDTIRIELSNGLIIEEQVLAGGNIEVHRADCL